MSLISDYELIARDIIGYWEFSINVQRRLFFSFPKNLLLILGLRGFWKAFKRHTEMLSGESPEWYRNELKKNVTSEERKSEFGRILLNDHPIEQLSIHLENKWAGKNFEQMCQIHDLRKQRISRLNLAKVIGIIFGAGAFLLGNVPKPVIEKLDFLSYDIFQFGVFWVTVAFVFYAGMLIFPIWRLHSRTLPRYEFVGEVLKYTAIRLG